MSITTLLEQAVCGAVSGPERVLVVGVGDDRQRDDGVGPTVVRRLCRQSDRSAGMRLLSGSPEDLRVRWGRAELAVMVLAARHDSGHPGRVHMLATELPPGPGDGTARLHRLAGLPRRVVIYTVEGGSFAAGTGLSPEVETMVDRLADHIRRQITALPASQTAVPDQRGEEAARPDTTPEHPADTRPPALAALRPDGVGPKITPRR